MKEYFDTEWREPVIEGTMQKKLSEIHGRKTWIDYESFFFNDLENLWLGVTAENQQRADERIPILLQIPAAVHFVSAEPLLGPLDLSKYLATVNKATCLFSNVPNLTSGGAMAFKTIGLDLAIVGGESGPHARPMHPDWARWVVQQCVDSQVYIYFKQWGEWLPYDVDHILENSGDILPNTIALCKNGEIVKVTKENFMDLNDYEVIDCMMYKVGTKKSGCLLDGQEWNEFPEIK
jgi:hypothetical protein